MGIIGELTEALADLPYEGHVKGLYEAIATRNKHEVAGHITWLKNARRNDFSSFGAGVSSLMGLRKVPTCWEVFLQNTYWNGKKEEFFSRILDPIICNSLLTPEELKKSFDVTILTKRLEGLKSQIIGYTHPFDETVFCYIDALERVYHKHIEACNISGIRLVESNPAKTFKYMTYEEGWILFVFALENRHEKAYLLLFNNFQFPPLPRVAERDLYNTYFPLLIKLLDQMGTEDVKKVIGKLNEDEAKAFLGFVVQNNNKQLWGLLVAVHHLSPLVGSKFGYDPLMMAAHLGDIELFDFLINFEGGKRLLRNKTYDNKTFWDFAKASKSGAFMNHVREYYANNKEDAVECIQEEHGLSRLKEESAALGQQQVPVARNQTYPNPSGQNSRQERKRLFPSLFEQKSYTTQKSTSLADALVEDARKRGVFQSADDALNKSYRSIKEMDRRLMDVVIDLGRNGKRVSLAEASPEYFKRYNHTLDKEIAQSLAIESPQKGLTEPYLSRNSSFQLLHHGTWTFVRYIG